MRPHVVAWLDHGLPHHISLLVAPTWFTCVGLAGLVALIWMMRIARRSGIDPAVFATAILWGYLAAVVAGIVVPMAIDAAEQYVARGAVHPRWSGMTSFWGYLAGFGAVYAVCRSHGVALGRIGDVAAAPLGLALALCRLGCFLAGCDYGKVTSGPWAVRFPSGSPAWRDHVRAGLVPPGRVESLPVHPTQLYESMLGLVMIAVAVWAARRPWARARHGRVFLASAATYAIGRIAIETLRGDAGRGLYAGMSSGQIFSLVMLAAIAIAVAIEVRWSRRKLASAMAAAAAMLGMIAADPAEAQPGASTAATAPGPISPYPDPVVAPPAAPKQGRRIVEAGVLLGWATPINRRSGQVAPLAGPSLSAGITLGGGFGLWLDFDSLGNQDASHGTIMLCGSVTTQLRDKISVGGRLGIGSTLVNFDEPTFRDVAGPSLRAEAIASYDLSDRWALWLRPLTFEVLSNDNLGGPITTWQARIGLAARLGPRRSM